MSNAHVHPTIARALAPFAPPGRHAAAGVVRFSECWYVYVDADIDMTTPFATRTQAIDELRKRDRAATFCESER